MALVEFIAGAVEEMEPHTMKTLQRLRATLSLAPIALPQALDDPLKPSGEVRDAAE